MAYPLLGIAMVAVGAAAVVIGGVVAVTSRRPRWLTTKTTRSGFERSWGIGLGLAGLGLVLAGGGDVGVISKGLRLAGYALIVGGVGFVVVATPRSPGTK
jgi:hypothetical protein